VIVRVYIFVCTCVCVVQLMHSACCRHGVRERECVCVSVCKCLCVCVHVFVYVRVHRGTLSPCDTIHRYRCAYLDFNIKTFISSAMCLFVTVVLFPSEY